MGPFSIPEPHDSLTNLTQKKSRLFSPKFLLANINELTNCRNLREEHAKSDRISKLEGKSERNRDLTELGAVICGSSGKRRQTKCLLLKVNNFFVNGDILVFSRQVFPPFC